jgi:very-short-patch-repair endonuclease
MKPTKKTLTERAKSLRKNNTYTEHIIWMMLRSRRFSHYKFKRQYVIEPYIVDFICLSKRLIVELDGDVHEMTIEYDQTRTEFLESRGFRVLRFWNEAVLNGSPVEEKILSALDLPLLSVLRGR